MTLTRMLWSSTGRKMAVRRSGAAIARGYAEKGHRDHQSIESNPGPQKKNYDDAKSYHQEKDNSLSEGHSVTRSSQARTFQDTHTQEVSNAKAEKTGSSSHGTETDTINLTSGENTGKAEQQRKAHATPKSKFQPGQKGDQVGGGASEHEGRQPNEGKVGTQDSPKNTTFSAMGQAARNFVGKGPASGFHTYARIAFPAVPESAVDKGARKSKDGKVEGAQNSHLPHHNAGEGDKMPAVKNNASLPSKQGDASHKKAPKSHNVSGERQVGTANTPGTRAVDPATQTHSASFAPQTGPQATYTHVVNAPEPSSHKSAYAYSTQTTEGGKPSGSEPRSSTSTSPYPQHTTAGLLKKEAGIGSSNDAVQEPLKGADEMVAKQQLGGAGDDVGGRGQKRGNQLYRPPPDVGVKIEDKLPKPIKK